MKSQKGITLTSLVIYVIVATIIIGAMAMISSTFFSNMKLVQDQDEYAPEFNKFSMFFIQDCKNNTKAEVSADGTQVTFENGTIIYKFDETQNAISRNGTLIAEKVQKLNNQNESENKIFTTKSELTPDTNTTKQIITVHLKIGSYSKELEKTIDYVLRYY